MMFFLWGTAPTTPGLFDGDTYWTDEPIVRSAKGQRIAASWGGDDKRGNKKFGRDQILVRVPSCSPIAGVAELRS